MSAQPACQYCGLHIQFGRTENGKSMPIDLTPSDDGNVVFINGDGRSVRVLKKGEVTDRVKFKAHFATCPRLPKRGPKR